MSLKSKEQLCINALRILSVDAINKAKSGHPGIVLGAAPMLHTLYYNHMNVTPKQKDWINRDRFILGAGHGSALLYSMLHFIGYKISLEDIKNFRQINSITPGHPEFGHTDGIDATSGPLGQGIPTAVGMAICENILRNKFNKDNFNVIDHYTYVLTSDGDLQEGVSQEAISLAGHLKLNKLILLFDSNDIQLDGEVKLSNTENHKKKFESMNWNYLKVEDGNNIIDINNKIKKAKKSDKPTIIEIKTKIGYGAPTEGTSKVHGAPIGLEDAKKLREKLNWNYDLFDIPNEVYATYKKIARTGNKKYKKWINTLNEYKVKYENDYNMFIKYINNDFKIDYNNLPNFNDVTDSTRKISGKLIEHFSSYIPNLIGGSADLTASTFAKGSDGHYSFDNPLGRNINYGVREHAMGAITNGITLYKAFKAFSGAFFVFSDYMKPAIRMAAIMKIPSIFIFSHDSVLVGEDGPTHQPIEQFAGLRVIPNLNVIRPADANETKAAWIVALESTNAPTIITLTRQALPALNNINIEDVKKGAYILDKEDSSKELDYILLVSGSEVELALKTKNDLKDKYNIRIVSIPSPFLFEKQSNEYKMSILPNRDKTIAVEMGVTNYWYKYAKYVYGIDEFGQSGYLEDVRKYFKFTKEDFISYIENL